MIRPEAVFDASILISGFLSPYGAPGRIVEWLQQGSIAAVLDHRCAAEYAEVLSRPELGIPQKEAAVLLACRPGESESAPGEVDVLTPSRFVERVILP